MCASCNSGTQAAYNMQSNIRAGSFTNNNAAMTGSDSVNEGNLPNAQNKAQEGVAAVRSKPHTAEQTGWGS